MYIYIYIYRCTDIPEKQERTFGDLFPYFFLSSFFNFFFLPFSWVPFFFWRGGYVPPARRKKIEREKLERGKKEKKKRGKICGGKSGIWDKP